MSAVLRKKPGRKRGKNGNRQTKKKAELLAFEPLLGWEIPGRKKGGGEK